MTIQVEIRPEMEAELSRRATLSGRAPEAYAADLLEEALHLSSTSETSPRTRTGTGADIIATMQRMPFKNEIEFEREPYYPPTKDFVNF